MSFERKVYLQKPHICRKNGVWCVYFSGYVPGSYNWKAWAFALNLQEEAHYYHAQ